MKKWLILWLMLGSSLAWGQMSRVRPPMKPYCENMPTVGRTIGELCANTNDSSLYFWDGTQWLLIGSGTGDRTSLSAYDYIISNDPDGTTQALNGSTGAVITRNPYANYVLQAVLDLCYPAGCSIRIKPGTYTYVSGIYPESYSVVASPKFRANTTGWTLIHGEGSIFKVTRAAPNFLMPDADVDQDGTVASPYGPVVDSDDLYATYRYLEIRGIQIEGLTNTEPLRGPTIYGSAWAEAGYYKNSEFLWFRDIKVINVNPTFDYNGDGEDFTFYDTNHDNTPEDFNGDGTITYAGDHDAGLSHPLGVSITLFTDNFGTSGRSAVETHVRDILCDNLWVEGAHTACTSTGTGFDRTNLGTQAMNSYIDNFIVNGVYWDGLLNINDIPYVITNEEATPSGAIHVGQEIPVRSVQVNNIIGYNSGDNFVEINNFESANVSNVSITDARYVGVFLRNYARLYQNKLPAAQVANLTNITKRNFTGIMTNRAPSAAIVLSSGDYLDSERFRPQYFRLGTVNITNVAQIDYNTTKTPPNAVVSAATGCPQTVNIKNAHYYFPNSKIAPGLEWDGPITMRCNSGPGVDYDGTSWSYSEPGSISVDGLNGYINLDEDGTGATQFNGILIDAINYTLTLKDINLNVETVDFDATEDYFNAIWLSPNAPPTAGRAPVVIQGFKVNTDHPGVFGFLQLPLLTSQAAGYPLMITGVDLTKVSAASTINGVVDNSSGGRYDDINIFNSLGLASMGSRTDYNWLDPNGDGTQDYKFGTTTCDAGEALIVQPDGKIGCGSAGLPLVEIMEDYNSTATTNGFLIEESANCDFYRQISGTYPDRDPITQYSAQSGLLSLITADSNQCVVGYSGLDTSSTFSTTTEYFQVRKLQEFNVRAGLLANNQSEHTFLFGGIRTQADKDYFTKQAGLFYWCDPASDVDNDGTVGDVDLDGTCGETGEDGDDCDWYGVSMNNGTAFASDDTTLCNNTNTTCVKMGVDCGGQSSTNAMNRFSIKKSGATYQFGIYNESGTALGSGVQTISTNIPAVDELVAFWGWVHRRGALGVDSALVVDYWQYIGSR